MEVHDLPERRGQAAERQARSGRLAGVQGRLARPFWGLMGIWATLCGALASNRLGQDQGGVLVLVLVVLLTDLAWGSLWDLVVGTDWRRILGSARSAYLVSPVVLPFTQPASPAARLFRQLGRFAGWWRGDFWPAAGPVVLGILAAGVLAAVLTWLLPERVRSLNLLLAAFVGLGLTQCWRGGEPLAGQSLVQVGLGWLAGHAAFAGLEWPSVLLATFFAVAAWGALRADEGQPGGLGLLNGGHVAAVVLLVGLKQPLAAGAVALLFLGQVALQPALYRGAVPSPVVRRMWPWLMASMIVAAPAIP